MRSITLLSLFSFLLCYYSIFFTFETTLASAKCLEDQQSLLLQFKNNLTFVPKSTTCCNWRGVTCDSKGYVIGLDLTEEYINGRFDNSNSLFSLQYLQRLYLAYNNFNSSIPSAFNKLEKLTDLDLSNNEFVGQIPKEISQLTRLVNLYLSNCKFYGTLPNSISNLTRLEHLDLSDNYLSGSIPSSLFTLPSLEEIYLTSNQFSKFDEFINVSSSVLKYLDLSRNNI